MLAMCFILILNMYQGVVLVGNGKVETCARDTCAVRHRGTTRYVCARARQTQSLQRDESPFCRERQRDREHTVSREIHGLSKYDIYIHGTCRSPSYIYFIHTLLATGVPYYRTYGTA